MKSIWLWVVAGLVAGSALGAGLYFTLTAKGKSQTQHVQVSERSDEAKERATLEQVAKSGFAKEAGQVSFTQLQKDAKGWNVQLEAQSDITDKPTMLEGAKRLFGELRALGVHVVNAGVVLRSNGLRDDYGQEIKDLVIARISFREQSFNRIDWKEIEPSKLEKVADVFWVNPLLPEEKQQQPKQAQQIGGQQSGSIGGPGGSEPSGGP